MDFGALVSAVLFYYNIYISLASLQFPPLLSDDNHHSLAAFVLAACWWITVSSSGKK